MPTGISVKRLNSFLNYPYLIVGWGEFSDSKLSDDERGYSIYRMLNPDLIELVPLLPEFIDNRLINFQGSKRETRSLYQLYCQSGEFLSPFSKGCVKILRELYPMLYHLGAFKPDWETEQSQQGKKKYSAEYLRNLGESAYDMLDPNFSIKRGNKVMANPRGSGSVVQSEDIKGNSEELTGRTRQPSKAYQLYNSLKAEKPDAESVHNFYWLLTQQFGDIAHACEVLQDYDKHLASFKFTVGSKQMTLQEKAATSREFGYSSEEIQRVLEQDILVARDSYSIPERKEK